MTKSPAEAYQAAREARAGREKAEADRLQRQSSFPAIAKARLEEFAKAIHANTPAGLRADISETRAGSTPGGIIGLFIKLYEGDTQVAQASINCTASEEVHYTSYAPEGQTQRSKSYGHVSFERADTQTAVRLLSNTIVDWIK